MNYLSVCLHKLWLRIYIPLLYHDKKQRKTVLKQKTTALEKSYLSRYLPALQNNLQMSETTNKTIFICWLQGMDNAPEVVKKCYESVRRHCKNYKIAVITQDNMADYVTFPDYIIKKHQNGIISNTHFSDLLRVALLAKHGGVWLDATVFLTAPLPAEITESDFFAYHIRNSFVGSNSWLLQSKADHPLLVNMQNLLWAYWMNENKLLNYFLYHIFFDLMIESNQQCADLWRKTPVIYDECYKLEANFFTPYSAKLWQQINNETHIHKLSYKYKKQPLENSFLQAFLAGKLGD